MLSHLIFRFLKTSVFLEIYFGEVTVSFVLYHTPESEILPVASHVNTIFTAYIAVNFQIKK